LTRTSKLVVDSWAWVEYFGGSAIGKKVEAAFSEVDEIWTSAVSIAEIVSKYRRKNMDESRAIEALYSLSRIGSPNREDAREAGRIHAELKAKLPSFGLADSFVLQLARKLGARVLTGDPDFRGIKEAELLS